MQRSSISFTSFIFVALVYLLSFFYFHRYTFPLAGGDEGGYYAYLPSILLYHDAGSFQLTAKAARPYCGNVPANDIFSGVVLPTPTGMFADKYTSGIAFLQLPFFYAAYFTSFAIGASPDGYSSPFRFFIHLSGLIYPLLGLWVLMKTLRRNFSESTTSISMVVIGLATNLYFFSVYNSPMAHSYLFFLYCLLIYFTIRLHEHLNWKVAVYIGLSCGLITMIRPNEVICIFIPLVYGIQSGKDFVARIKSFARHYKYVLIGCTAFLIAVLPQLIYWKFSAGRFFYYSYRGESFDFLHPHIIRGLFGWGNGWLTYTPVMFFSLFGIFLPSTKRTGFLWPLLVILPLFVYVIYSWWCWNYINGFGSRPMVELYPLLAFSLAGFIDFAIRIKLLRWIVAMLLAFFTWLNIFSTYQYSKINRWSEDANFPYFLAAFGKTQMDMRMLTTFDLGVSQPTNLTYARTIFEDHFEDSTDQHFTKDAFNGQFAYGMNKSDEYSKFDTISQATMNLHPGEYLKISFLAKKEIRQRQTYSMLTFNTQFSVSGKDGEWQWVRVANKLTDSIISLWWSDTGKWYPVSFFIKPPKHLQPNDFIRLFLYNGCRCDEVKIDDVKVEVWK